MTRIILTLAKHWFLVHILMVISGLLIAILYNNILYLTDNFFKVMISFMCISLVSVGLIGLAVNVYDTYRKRCKL